MELPNPILSPPEKVQVNKFIDWSSVRFEEDKSELVKVSPISDDPFFDHTNIQIQVDRWWDIAYTHQGQCYGPEDFVQVANSVVIHLKREIDTSYRIGLYKQRGETAGQGFFVSLAEAHRLVIVLLKLLESLYRNLNRAPNDYTRYMEKKSFEDLLSCIPQKWSFEFYDFKPSVAHDGPPVSPLEIDKPDCMRIVDKIKAKKAIGYGFMEWCKLPTCSILYTKFQKHNRHSIAVEKTSGVGCEQVVWMSVFEAQWICFWLWHFIQRARTEYSNYTSEEAAAVAASDQAKK
jgi:hypothetical protein